MPLSPFRRLLLVALLLAIVWALFGPSGIGEELLSLTLSSLLPAPASPGPPLALPRLLIPNHEACGGPGAPPFLLILAAFQDSYRNLTLKTLSGLNWADKHCPRARYILKTDDDVYVNVPEMVSELVLRGGRWEQWERDTKSQREPVAENEEGEGQALVNKAVPLLYLGRVHWRVKPSRTPGGKHWVSEEQWPHTWGHFPPYASGTGYVLSASAVQLILKVASRAPRLPLEDVFVGVSAWRGGLAPTHCVKLAGATHYPLDRCCYGKFLLTSHKVDPWKMKEAWKLVGGSDGARTAPFCSWLQEMLGILRCRVMAWLYS
ncbi:Beta-1,3-galactosyltransferase 4 [Tupaia chinensis]|uniref:Hexosyltransferase n=1 Tax=Tupaia chinensis TaxID=246437 RepID=L9L3M7_TUPCH|nr:Beta-1,3-galactosyltransferase 4 [Tupaia chinensis]